MATSLYAKPRTGVNWVGWGLLLALLASGYFAWKYLPVYQSAWEVDKLLNETIAKAYHLNRQREPERSQHLRTLLLDLRGKLPGAKVTDPNAAVTLEEVKGELVLKCTYTTHVEHFGTDYPMAMVRTAQTDAHPMKLE